MTCVVVAGDKPVLRCTVCQGEKPFSLPLAISQATLLIRDFQREHAQCREQPPTWAQVKKGLPT